MTQQELKQKHDKYVADNNGKYVKVLPNNLNPQCFDEIVGFTNVLGVPHYPGQPSPFPYANAYQIYTDFGAFQADFFTRIANDATFIPKPGDILVWSSSKPGTGGAGHTATATGVGDTNTFQAFSQNDPTNSPCVLKTYNYSYLLGVLRLKVTGATPPMDPMIQKKASRYDVIEHDDKGASIDTNKITDAEFEATRATFKNRKEGNGKWGQTCDLAGVAHSSTPQQVADKFKSMGGCSPAQLSKAKEEGRKLGIQQAKDTINKLS